MAKGEHTSAKPAMPCWNGIKVGNPVYHSAMPTIISLRMALIMIVSIQTAFFEIFNIKTVRASRRDRISNGSREEQVRILQVVTDSDDPFDICRVVQRGAVHGLDLDA